MIHELSSARRGDAGRPVFATCAALKHVKVHAHLHFYALTQAEGLKMLEFYI